MKIERKEVQLDSKAGAVLIDLKELSEDGEFEGYGSTFGNVDQGMDLVEPGAFKRTLKAKKLPQIKMLRDHNTRQIIGQWLELSEDDRGLKARGRLFIKETDHVPLARETYTLMRAKALDAMSIGYRTVKAAYDETSGVRRLKELDLWEISVVTFPMNDLAKVGGVKADLSIRDVERILREGGAPDNFAKLVAIHGYDGAKARLGSRREGGAGSELADFLRDAALKMKA